MAMSTTKLPPNLNLSSGHRQLISRHFSPNRLLFSTALNFCTRKRRRYSSFPSLSTSMSAVTLALSLPSSSYGPSLRKGCKIASDSEIDEDSFTRVFSIAALRVPAKDCNLLEHRLRGHLLNWPRIRNIARVPGDDVEHALTDLLPQNDDVVEREASFDRRMYGRAEGDGDDEMERAISPVLYRDKLVRSFNSCGFRSFKNLAKMSRPRKWKREVEKEEGEGGVDERMKRVNRDGRNGFALVEVVDDGNEEGDWSGLLGNEFKGRWKGPTRLLLLDESYESKAVDQLPGAIKVMLRGDDTTICPAPELVRCKLTLYYSYWQMDEILEALLPDGMIVPSAYETVGHIAHLNLRDEHLPYKKLIAKVVLDKNSSKIQTVVNKTDAIHNNYRTMQLEVLAGNHSLVATVVENGLRFQVDLAKVYWNSRLATERQRLLNSLTRDDIVCDVFAGVGPIAVAAAKKVKRVYANDLNPQAVDYLERNSVLNKLERRVEVFNMDGRRFIHAMFTSSKAESITQVVMNLPTDAAEYLDAFKGVYRNKPKNSKITLPTIHVYGFSKASDPEFDFEERIRIALGEVAFEIKMHKVRLVAPGKWMLCGSFTLPQSVAFGKPTVSL